MTEAPTVQLQGISLIGEANPRSSQPAVPVVWAGRHRPLSWASCAEGLATSTDYDAFFEANYWPIVRSLTAAFGGEAAVEEAVQEAFIRAYSKWRRIRGYDAPAAWVRRVAINRLHDQHRSRGRRRRAEQAAWETTGEQVVEARDQPESGLVTLIESLAPRQRLAMALYYVGDVSVRDIAATMRISEGAVKAHLSQGRANLAKLAAEAQGATSSETTDG